MPEGFRSATARLDAEVLAKQSPVEGSLSYRGAPAEAIAALPEVGKSYDFNFDV